MRSFRSAIAAFALLTLVAVAVYAGTAAARGGAARSTGSKAAVAPGLARAKKIVAAAFKPPTKIPVTKPLKRKPAKKTVAFIEPQLPAGKSQTAGFRAAATAMGWNIKVIPADPFKPAGAVQQAIDEKVNYIFMTAAATALFPEQLANARKAGIPILSCYGTDPPGGKSGKNAGLYAQCGDATSAILDGALMADWAAVDSNGKAHILIANVPDYPILVAQVNGFKARISRDCPKCVVKTLNVTLTDLGGGKVPAAIASKLQANTDVNYLFFTFSDLPTGVYDTLASSGLAKNLKLFELDFNEARLKELQTGKMKVAMGLPKEYSAWLLMDFAARLSQGEKLTNERKLANLPRIIVGKKQAAQYLKTNYQWPGPVGFKTQFKKLWHRG